MNFTQEYYALGYQLQKEAGPKLDLAKAGVLSTLLSMGGSQLGQSVGKHTGKVLGQAKASPSFINKLDDARVALRSMLRKTSNNYYDSSQMHQMLNPSDIKMLKSNSVDQINRALTTNRLQLGDVAQEKHLKNYLQANIPKVLEHPAGASSIRKMQQTIQENNRAYNDYINSAAAKGTSAGGTVGSGLGALAAIEAIRRILQKSKK